MVVMVVGVGHAFAAVVAARLAMVYCRLADSRAAGAAMDATCVAVDVVVVERRDFEVAVAGVAAAVVELKAAY